LRTRWRLYTFHTHPTDEARRQPSNDSQKAAFIAAAKAAGADADEKRWEARLKAVAKSPAKPVKKGK
jgi:hypothetical protein